MATNNVGQVQSLFPTTTTNTTQYDPLLMGTLTDIINAARTQANTPYQAYPGQRYAQLTPEELQANQAVRDNFLKTQPMYDTAGNLINQGTSQLNNLTQNMGQWNPNAASQYMNPYISNVVQAQTNNMLNNANIERNRIRSNAAQAGAFGGGRQFVAEQQMNDDLNRRLDDTTSNLMMQGYNTAYDQFNKDRQFGLEGVKQYGAQADLNSALAGARNTAYYGDVNNLNTVGQNLRDIAQANLDYDYSNFQNQRDYGKNQLGWISGLLNGTNLGQFQTGSTTTNRTQLPAAKSSFTNDLMTGLGYAANLANTDIGKSVGSWISSWFANGGYVEAKNKYAKGGEVKKYAEGGPTQVDILNARRRARLEAARRNQPFPFESDDMRITALLKGLGNTAGAVVPGVMQAYEDIAVRPLASLYDYATAPAFGLPQTSGNFNPAVGSPLANAPLDVREVPVLPVQQPAQAQTPQTITEMLDNEITAVNQPDNLPVGVSELMLPQQEEISLNDLFTYSGGPLDALMQPNPLIMQGLYGKMTSGDLGEMWRAAGQIDAMNNYEDMRSGRMQTDTQRGAAIGELAERRTARKQTNALEQRKMEIEQQAAQMVDPLKQAQTMLVLAKINQMGKLKPATAKDILDKVKAANEALASGGLDEQRHQDMIDQLMDQLDNVGGSSGVNDDIIRDNTDDGVYGE